MERYWDGRLWTDDTRPLAMAPAPSGPVIGRTTGGGWDWKWLLFSFKGRAHRAHYWTVSGGFFALVLVLSVIVLVATRSVSDVTAGDGDELSPLFGLVFLVFFVVIVWVSLAVGVKRWHDRDKSGAWMLITLIPLGIGPLWVLVECGFLPGTDGPNQYGGDPRRVPTTPY